MLKTMKEPGGTVKASPTVKRVMVVDDDEGLNRLLQKALRKAGFEAQGAFTGSDAIVCATADPELILLLDQHLPDMSGTQLIRTLNERDCSVPFVAMTGHGDEKIAVEMMKLGARDYLTKNLDLIDLVPKVFRRVFRELDTEKRLAASEAERERLEKQFHQAQKLESIGRLAGGVAHDLNNLLSPILGYGELLLLENAGADRRRENVEQILKAGRRARDLVRQLLAFSRRQTLQFRPIDLNALLKNFQKLIRRTIREDVDIRILPTKSLPLIKGDMGQLEQVVMNLAVNAQDAMPDGGALIIETGSVELDEHYASEHEGVTPGLYVLLTFSDTGTGMDSETLGQLFEPFFTTKELHEGTGLGLSTVYGIVKQHGGNVWAYSEPGLGATFKIYLPVSTESLPVGNRPPESEAKGGSETILLVEDDEDVRELAFAILERNGYALLVAESGQEALSLLEHHDGPLHLILTDVVMPGINGRQLFDQASVLYPHAKALYMSGYTRDVIAHRGVIDAGVNFIQKPFSVKLLATRVREVLDQT
jgi:two-component system cell cycle sensor histidine kinase/response regulator CckA